MHYARSHSLVVTGSSGISVPVGWKGCGQRSLSSIMGRARIAPVSAGDCALASDTAQALSLGVRHGWETAVTRGVGRARCFLLHPNWVSWSVLRSAFHPSADAHEEVVHYPWFGGTKVCMSRLLPVG